MFHWFPRIKISSWLLVQINYQFCPKVLASLFFHNFFFYESDKGYYNVRRKILKSVAEV